jgi:transcriptional regulator with XRE-family HTH domain
LPEKKRQPSRLRQQIGRELRAARLLAGLSQEALAQALGKASQSFSARVESGERLLSRPELLTWLGQVGAPRDVRDRVLVLNESAHSETEQWQDLLAGQEHLQEKFRSRDHDARIVQIYDPTVLTGLLQTPDYARFVIPLADITQQINHAAALASRIERQGLLREPGRSFQFVITERLLRWEPGAGVRGPQLAHLVAVAQLDVVDLAVLPDDYNGALPWHNFSLRHPADGSPPYVATELLHGAQTISDPDSVAIYEAMWDRLWRASVTGDEAVARIRREAAQAG